MSLQRRRGQYAEIYPSVLTEDNRGNELYVVDMEADPIKVRAAFIPDRSARAEVPGQQEINVFSMILRADIPHLSLWSRVKWAGAEWDVVSPPALHFGVRATRHVTLSIRRRPSA